LLPTRLDAAAVQPEDILAMKDFIEQNRSHAGPFDIVVDGQTIGLAPAAQRDKLQPWQAAGATWWLESLYQVSHEQAIERLLQGPPVL
jgi:hypothetical protein